MGVKTTIQLPLRCRQSSPFCLDNRDTAESRVSGGRKEARHLNLRLGGFADMFYVMRNSDNLKLVRSSGHRVAHHFAQ